MTRTTLHAFNPRSPQNSTESVKFTPPPELYELGLLEPNCDVFWGFDPVAHLAVVSTSYARVRDIYGDDRAGKGSRVVPMKIEETRVMTIPKCLTPYLEHGTPVDVVNIRRDDQLVFFAFDSMLRADHNTFYVGTVAEYYEMLENPLNRLQFAPTASPELENTYIPVVWEGKKTLSRLRPEVDDGQTEVWELFVPETDDGLSTTFDIPAAEADALLFGYEPATEVIPERAMSQL
ncbi:hypothetical protein [Natrialbaceae archaeon AArc-T1-2]|uniref:hypothetical protein n=1 Tax=Natrialbaceae archaeon AArc-T1-2 TaxID=3053904 RepID=UPI00255AD34C|nr:hypothetical protein [Natrialbaceae archaeon AArc-T1-2]WIV65871.1 hypothetical protein QQ977_09170 [Natrialbaceae archaeon AArc-T1-2]